LINGALELARMGMMTGIANNKSPASADHKELHQIRIDVICNRNIFSDIFAICFGRSGHHSIAPIPMHH